MKDLVNKFTLRSVLISICLAALGVIIIMNANEVLFWVIKAIGLLLIIDAVIRFIQFIRLDSEERSINFDIIRAIIEAVLGIVALVNSSSVVTLLYIFIGVIVVVEGILHLQFVITRKNKLEHWIINFFIAIVNILCGVFIIAHPILTSGFINIIIGIEILVSSILGIISYIYLFVNLRRVAKEIDDTDD
ncbi:MAG: DUF308 domain-containing protein [Ruminococcus sp.]|nr:DUF308 domain-containing protein [Ruminococcus sp.]